MPYWDQWVVEVAKPERYRSREEFLGKLSEGVGPKQPMDPEECACAVFGVLARHVRPGEVEQVKQSLPEDVRSLFPQG